VSEPNPSTTPSSFVREAIKAVPAVKYAVGIGGIVAVVAIVESFRISYLIATFGAVVMLVLMTVLVVFAGLAGQGQKNLKLPMLVFTWFSILLAMATALALFGSVFGGWPIDLRNAFASSPVKQKPSPATDLPNNKSDAPPNPGSKPDKHDPAVISPNEKHAEIVQTQNPNDLETSPDDLEELLRTRGLRIVDVYDAGENGKPQKLSAQVFFTKNKSLIFYAYDLGQLPGATGTFQGWGRRGKQTVNLGVFNHTQSNEWKLQVEEPGTLQQIDAVFVTIEPNGVSEKPDGKKLLFTYLQSKQKPK
jgi:hypothetical protein